MEAILGKNSGQKGDLRNGLNEGYPHIAALLITYAATVAGCNHNAIMQLDKNLAECLEEIKNAGIRVEKLVLRYAEELKKLATSFYAQR